VTLSMQVSPNSLGITWKVEAGKEEQGN